MTTSIELDPAFRQALRLLHSSSTDAAENIRKTLDDIIKQRYGPSKMLINTLSKKNLAEESLATGSGVAVVPPPPGGPIQLSSGHRRYSYKSSDSSSNNSNSSPIQLPSGTILPAGTDISVQSQDIPMIISLSDSGEAINDDDNNIMLDDEHLKDFEELACVVCHRIDLSAKNRLIECTKCNSLYHQDCHKPQISDADLIDELEDSWCCTNCTKLSKTQALIASPAKSSSSSHSSESSSSSSNCIAVSSSSSSKRSSSEHHGSSSHGSGSSSSKSKSRSGSSSKSSVTPNINIISADKRIQNMKKKAAKSHESKRKHKSSH